MPDEQQPAARGFFFALLVTLVATVAASAADPFADLAKKYADLTKQLDDLKKQRDQAGDELKKLHADNAKLLADLGLAGPSPKPDDPKPKPPEPKPIDPLAAKLKAAFDADPVRLDKRRNQALDLAALYREAAKLAQSADVDTAGDLLQRVKAAAGSLVGADALKGVRQVVAGELGALFPADGPLSDEQRKKAAELFGKLAAILDSLGG